MRPHGGARGGGITGCDSVTDSAMLLHRGPPGLGILEIAGKLFEIGCHAHIVNAADEPFQRRVGNDAGHDHMEIPIKRQRQMPVVQRRSHLPEIIVKLLDMFGSCKSGSFFGNCAFNNSARSQQFERSLEVFRWEIGERRLAGIDINAGAHPDVYKPLNLQYDQCLSDCWT